MAKINNSKYPYIFVRDESGHWYLIPESQLCNFQDWVYDTENDRKSEFNFSKNAIVGALSSVKIYSWKL